MSDTHKIKRNDTGQVFSSTLTVNGAPYNLTGMTAWFLMTNLETGDTFRKQGSVINAAAGQVEYYPAAEDVDTSGTYKCEWEVDNAGLLLTFPSGSYLKLTIVDDLG